MERKGLVISGEAARRLGITPATLRKRIRRGELEVFRDPLNDRVRLIRVEDLEALRALQPVENHASKGAAASGVAA